MHVAMLKVHPYLRRSAKMFPNDSNKVACALMSHLDIAKCLYKAAGIHTAQSDLRCLIMHTWL